MRTFPPKLVLCVSSLALSLATSAVVILPAHAQDVACPAPVVVQEAPPPLPSYDQPPIPGPGYLWTPGYWRWSEDEEDYYWVSGVWVEPPRPGLLWTPGYWGWAGGSYLFHPGYWGARVGFYGGINYGYGYNGDGYYGGRWRNGTFFYNRSVTNITNVRVNNVYEEKVIAPKTTTNVSFNGGREGIQARPTTEQRTFAKEQHFAATTQQRGHVETSGKDKALFSKTNHGNPAASAAPALAPRGAPAAAPANVPASGVAPGAQGNHQGTHQGGHQGERPASRALPTEGGQAKPQGFNPQGAQQPQGMHEHRGRVPAGAAPQGGQPPAAAHEEKPAAVPPHPHAERPPAMHEERAAPKAPAMREERAAPRQDAPAPAMRGEPHPPAAMHAEPHPPAAMHGEPHPPAMHAEPHAPAAHPPAEHPRGGPDKDEHR